MQAPTNDLRPSGKANPCPICGRTTDGDCRISDALVLCRYGSTHHPPAGLKRGDTHAGWAYTGDTEDGLWATFTPDKPRSGSKVIPLLARTAGITLARLPQSAGEPPEHWPNGTRLDYGPEQWVVVRVGPSGKRHIPHHINAAGKAIGKAGPDPWPLWHEDDALAHGTGQWIAEAEGEKCGAWLRAGGLVAISQPGHDRSGGAVEARYRRLAAAGVAGVAYLADHDPQGAKHAKTFAAAAASAGLPFVVVRAADVWPGLPGGGSIDDAPGSAAARAAAFAAHVQRLKPEQTAQGAGDRFEPRQDTTARWGKRRMGHTRAMQCLERCIETQATRERNSFRRRARLLKAAADLGLQKYIRPQEIAQRVLEVKERDQGSTYKALTAADRAAMDRPVVRWLLPGLIPANDLTIIGGRPKVGKTRLAIAAVAAVLKGEPMLDLAPPAAAKPVVLITDDQADGDTAEMLTAHGIWDHPQLTWSPSFRLTEHDIDKLLITLQANPGAVVVLDSLRSIGRHLEKGENDPEIAATLYDLKQAVIDSGGTPLLIHHCNKAADLVGVEALSGHNAIAGAANTVLTLHYLPGENGQPNKAIPERRLFREGRSGDGFDVVITRAGNGFRVVKPMDQWQQEAKVAQKLEKLTPLQEDTRAALERSGQWMTRRDVCEALDLPWGDRGQSKEAKNLAKALTRLVELGVIESASAGREATYRSHGTPRTGDLVDQPVIPMDLTDPHGWGSRGSRGSSPTPSDALIPLIPSEGIYETPCPDSLIPLIPTSGSPSPPREADLQPAVIAPPGWPDWGYDLLDLRAADPAAHPSALANALYARCSIRVDGRQVAELLKAWDQQQEAD